MRPLHASDSARMNRINATKDAATMKVDNKIRIRIFIATPALVVATTVFLKDNFYYRKLVYFSDPLPYICRSILYGRTYLEVLINKYRSSTDNCIHLGSLNLVL